MVVVLVVVAELRLLEDVAGGTRPVWVLADVASHESGVARVRVAVRSPLLVSLLTLREVDVALGLKARFRTDEIIEELVLRGIVLLVLVHLLFEVLKEVVHDIVLPLQQAVVAAKARRAQYSAVLVRVRDWLTSCYRGVVPGLLRALLELLQRHLIVVIWQSGRDWPRRASRDAVVAVGDMGKRQVNLAAQSAVCQLVLARRHIR